LSSWCSIFILLSRYAETHGSQLRAKFLMYVLFNFNIVVTMARAAGLSEVWSL